jgi:hypothetical protein
MRTIGEGVNRPLHALALEAVSQVPTSVGNSISWVGNHILGRIGFKQMDVNIIKDIHNQSPNGSEELFQRTMRNIEWRSF